MDARRAHHESSLLLPAGFQRADRQAHDELRTHTDLALDLDRALVLSDDAIRDRQSESCVFDYRFGGVERVEQPAQRLRCNARAGILGADADIGATRV